LTLISMLYFLWVAIATFIYIAVARIIRVYYFQVTRLLPRTRTCPAKCGVTILTAFILGWLFI